MDDPTQTVVMHRSEPSRLQSLALQLADKINNFVESNERILETKQGNFFLRGANQVSFFCIVRHYDINIKYNLIKIRIILCKCFESTVFIFFRATSAGIDKTIEVEIRKIGIVKEEITGGIINWFYSIFYSACLLNLFSYVSNL